MNGKAASLTGAGRAVTWRRVVAAAAGGVLLLAASACGVPSSGSPIVDGTVNANGGSGASGLPAGPPGPDDFVSGSAVEFVEGYLTALAGLPPTVSATDEVATVQAWIKTNSCQSSRVTACQPWQPQSPNVIDVVRAPVGGWRSTRNGLGTEVTGTVQVIGTFSPATGVLQPPPEPATKVTLTFQVVPNDTKTAGIWRLVNPPTNLYMSEDALSTQYAEHPVYFWNTDRTALIPDIHYLPNSLSPLRKATQIIDWVLDGHSSQWLGLQGSLVPGATLVDPTVRVTDATSNQYVVNLSASARGSDDQDKLGYQLQWSLGTLTADGSASAPSEVRLQIDGQDWGLSDQSSYREDVPNLQQARSYLPAATFGIANGAVVEFKIAKAAELEAGQGPRYTVSRSTGQPKVLASAAGRNSGVQSAAVDGTQTAAALVKHNSRTGSDELWVRWYTEGVASDFEKVTGLPPGPMLRPEFIVQQSKEASYAAAVVAAGGRLYIVAPSNHPVARLIGANPVTGAITSFSIAPDAHRIAYISAGRLYLSVLQNSGGSMTMSPANMISTAPGTRQVPDSDQPQPVGLDSISQVTWTNVDKLLVSGRRAGNTVIDEISADGSSAREITDYGAVTIKQLASYVYDPLHYPPSGDNLMLQTSGFAYSGPSQSGLLLQLPDPGHAAIDLHAPFFQD